MNNSANVVIDVPERISPEEAAQLLNAPGEAFFLVQVLPIAGGHRAYLRRYKQTPPTKAEAEKAHVDDATAMSILRVNREKPVRTIMEVLDKAGIKRSKRWVCEQLDATCAEDGREQEALSFVKAWAASPIYGPKEIVYDLWHGGRPGTLKPLRIKRSISWARRKLEEFRAAVPRDNS